MHRTNRSRAGRWRALVGAALLPVLFGGCSTMSHTDRGVLTGGALGTGLGAAVGSVTGRTGAGAAIGGITGAIAGGAIGSGQDRMERRQDARLAQIEAAQAQAAHPPLSLEEIRDMAHRGTSDQIIINQIRVTRSVYHLTAEQITWLQEQGVSERVIGEMQQTALRSPAPAPVVRQPVIYQPVVRPVRPVYVVDPCYHPYRCRPPVGIGFTFTTGRGRHHH